MPSAPGRSGHSRRERRESCGSARWRHAHRAGISVSRSGCGSDIDACHNKDASIRDRGKDRYGRTLGAITCAGVDANAEEVRRGMAWVFERYAAKDSPLYAVQAEARTARRGLWQDAKPVPPWEFRQRRGAK
jgi:hypothetical protein